MVRGDSLIYSSLYSCFILPYCHTNINTAQKDHSVTLWIVFKFENVTLKKMYFTLNLAFPPVKGVISIISDL